MIKECELFMKKKIVILAAFLLSSLLFVACTNSSENVEKNSTNAEASVEKPESITVYSNSFLIEGDELERFLAEYKEKTGVELKVAPYDRDNYYEGVNISIASEEPVDVYEVGGLYYPNFQNYGLLWDMTEAWENSSIKNVVDNTFVDALKIDNRLYGFPVTRGNGTVTYVRTDLIEKLGLKMPKTYDEFYSMLKAFRDSEEGFIPLTAAGLINSESPFNLYLREFFQDANPDIIYKDGEYVDGMVQPEMKEALFRMKQAYAEKLLDPDIAKNKTSNCRDKMYEGKVGCFNYWAGSWGKTLDEKIKENLGDSYKIEPMPCLNELSYIERPPLALVIPKICENPEGVFKYFIEYSHDAAEGEMLFTHGVEGEHWSKDSSGKIVKNMERNLSRSFLKPELGITSFDNPFPIDKKEQASLDILAKKYVMAPIPITSKNTGTLIPDLDNIRREIIEKIVTTDITLEEGYKEYEKQSQKIVARILNDLNSTKSITEEGAK